MKIYIFTNICILLYITHGSGAADHQVERVKNRYVEKQDLGPLMEAGQMQSHSSHGMHHNRLCPTCQQGLGSSSNFNTGGPSSQSSSYGSSSSYSNFGGMGMSPSFHQPRQSSSRHEIKKEQEFVNGQQVYDFHHEKKYEDGKLVKEKRYENAPDDVATNGIPGQASAYNLGNGQTSSSNSAHSSQTGVYGSLPQNSYGNQYQGSSHSTYGYDHSEPRDDFSEQLQSELDRLHEEMRQNTFSLSHQPVGSIPAYPSIPGRSPIYGGSHKTEFRTQTKYVNGQPVYMLNEERKYKDGNLIHNVTEEKGPHDLGTAGVAVPLPLPVLTSPSGSSYSSHHEEVVRSQSHIPSSRYPNTNYPSSHPYYSQFSNTDYSGNAHRPSPYGSSSEISSSSSTYPVSTSRNTESMTSSTSEHQQPNYRQSPVYSPQVTDERKEIKTHKSGGHRPNSYENTYRDNEDVENSYRPYTPNSYGTSYQRPEHNYYPTTTTTSTTTARPTYIYRDGRYPTYTQAPRSRTQYNQESNYYSPNNRPVEATQKPYYNRETEINDNKYEERQRPQTSYRPGSIYHQDKGSNPENYPKKSYNTNTYSQSEEKEEVSQPSYYDSNPNKNRPTDTYPTYGSTRNQIEVVDQNKASRYRPGDRRTSHSEGKETERTYNIPSDESTYQSGVQTSSTSTQEERTHRVSSGYYPNTYESRRPNTQNNNNYYPNLPESAASPTPNIREPGLINGPEPDPGTDSNEEEERYDISPYDDASDIDKEKDAANFEIYPSRQPNRGSSYDRSSTSHTYDESQVHSRDPSRGYPSQRHPQHGGATTNVRHEYNERVKTVLPSRWVETKTTWKYVNGRIVSETQYHKYYENGLMVHENTTERNRDQMEQDGVNVLRLDLSATELAQYGPALTSSTHSQKHEVHQIKRFKDGHQTYELNHERLFQDGKLVDENRNEKDEDDFGTLNQVSGNHQLTQSQHLNQHTVTGAAGLHSAGFQSSGNPRGYVRRHEVRQEEEFINGQKVYDLHHEREYQDGKLIREDKAELGPDDLGTQGVQYRDTLKDVLSGRTHSSIGQAALLEQQQTSDNILATSCLTCGTAHGSSSHGISSHGISSHGSSSHGSSSQGSSSQGSSSQGSSSHGSSSHGSSSFASGSVLGSLGIPTDHGYQGGSTFRHDLNVEEHYENGQLVKGKEEAKKWVDGQLIDAKSKHYYDGPSRANLTLHGYDSAAEVSSASAGRVPQNRKLNEKCDYNPCINKGRCKESVRGSICICPFGFKGTHCEEAYCPNRYCRYGGSCYIADAKHVCECMENYSGYRCSTKSRKVRLGVSG